MKKQQQWTFLIIAWLGTCLLLLLAACSTSQHSLGTIAHYRATIVLAPGSEPNEVQSVLQAGSPVNVQLKPYYEEVDSYGRSLSPRTVILAFRNAEELEWFQENLLQAGLPSCPSIPKGWVMNEAFSVGDWFIKSQRASR